MASAKAKLWNALYYGRPQSVLNILDDEKISPNLKTSMFGGESLVHFALYGRMGNGYPFDGAEFLKDLVKRGANTNIKFEGEDLILSRFVDHSTAAVLLEKGANVNAQRKEDFAVRGEYKGDTALHLAIRSENHLLAMQLLDSGADMRLSNTRGQYPEDVANGLEEFNKRFFLRILKEAREQDLQQELDIDARRAKRLSRSAPNMAAVSSTSPVNEVLPSSKEGPVDQLHSEPAQENLKTEVSVAVTAELVKDAAPEISETSVAAEPELSLSDVGAPVENEKRSSALDSNKMSTVNDSTLVKDSQELESKSGAIQAGAMSEVIPESADDADSATTGDQENDSLQIENQEDNELVNSPQEHDEDGDILGLQNESEAGTEQHEEEEEEDLILGSAEGAEANSEANQDDDDLILGPQAEPSPPEVVADDSKVAGTDSVDETLIIIERINESTLDDDEKMELKNTALLGSNIVAIAKIISARIADKITRDDCVRLLDSTEQKSAASTKASSPQNAEIPFAAEPADRIQGAATTLARSNGGKSHDKDKDSRSLAADIGERLSQSGRESIAQIAARFNAAKAAASDRLNPQKRLDRHVETLERQFAELEQSSEVATVKNILDDKTKIYLEQRELLSKAPVTNTQNSLREISDTLNAISLAGKRAAAKATDSEAAERVLASMRDRVDQIFKSASDPLKTASTEAGNSLGSILNRFNAKISVFVARMMERVGLSKSAKAETQSQMAPG